MMKKKWTDYKDMIHQMEKRREWLEHLQDGEPCDHPGCLHHVSHPYEVCGRIAGKRIDILVVEEYE